MGRKLGERENGERARRRERMGRELGEMDEWGGGARGELGERAKGRERKWRELGERENGERARGEGEWGES